MAQQRGQMLEKRIRELEEMVQARDADILSHQSQIKQLTDDFTFNLELLKDRDAEIEQMERQLQSLKEAASAREEKMEQLQRSLIETQQQLLAEQAQGAESKVAHDSRVKSLEDDLQALKSRSEEARMGELESWKAKEQQLQLQLQQQRQQIEDNRVERTALISGWQGQLDDAKLANAGLREELERSGRLHEQARDTVERQRSELGEALKQVEALKEDKAVLVKQVAEAAHAVADLERRYGELSHDMQASVSQKDAQIQELERRVEEGRADQEANVGTLTESLEQLRGTCAQQADELKALAAEARQTEQDNLLLNSQLNDKEAALADRDAALATADEAAAALRAENAALQEQLREHQAHLEAVTDDRERTARGSQARAQALEEQVTELSDRLKEEQLRVSRLLRSESEQMHAKLTTLVPTPAPPARGCEASPAAGYRQVSPDGAAAARGLRVSAASPGRSPMDAGAALMREAVERAAAAAAASSSASTSPCAGAAAGAAANHRSLLMPTPSWDVSPPTPPGPAPAPAPDTADLSQLMRCVREMSEDARQTREAMVQLASRGGSGGGSGGGGGGYDASCTSSPAEAGAWLADGERLREHLPGSFGTRQPGPTRPAGMELSVGSPVATGQLSLAAAQRGEVSFLQLKADELSAENARLRHQLARAQLVGPDDLQHSPSPPCKHAAMLSATCSPHSRQLHTIPCHPGLHHAGHRSPPPSDLIPAPCAPLLRLRCRTAHAAPPRSSA